MIHTTTARVGPYLMNILADLVQDLYSVWYIPSQTESVHILWMFLLIWSRTSTLPDTYLHKPSRSISRECSCWSGPGLVLCLIHTFTNRVGPYLVNVLADLVQDLYSAWYLPSQTESVHISRMFLLIWSRTCTLPDTYLHKPSRSISCECSCWSGPGLVLCLIHTFTNRVGPYLVNVLADLVQDLYSVWYIPSQTESVHILWMFLLIWSRTCTLPDTYLHKPSRSISRECSCWSGPGLVLCLIHTFTNRVGPYLVNVLADLVQDLYSVWYIPSQTESVHIWWTFLLIWSRTCTLSDSSSRDMQLLSVVSS